MTNVQVFWTIEEVLYWTPHSEKGGNFSYLSPMDTYIFKKQIEENYLDMDCLRTIDGLELAYNLLQQRFYRGLKNGILGKSAS